MIYLLGVLAAMTVGTAVPEISFIGREFRPEDPSILGLVVSMPSLVVALGALIAGYFVDKLGDKKMLFVGTALMVAGD
ncbi:MAG: MFS transporter, partial [Comamonas sp.]